VWEKFGDDGNMNVHSFGPRPWLSWHVPQARSGFSLASSASRSQLTLALQNACTGAQPSRLDSRVWEKFGDDGKMNVHSFGTKRERTVEFRTPTV
jgi:hypothetical protein